MARQGLCETSPSSSSTTSSVTTSASPAVTPTSPGTSTSSFDPCVDYTLVRDQYQRSTGYVTPPGQPNLCDLRLQTAWYRFQSGAGEDLQPMSNCSLNTCGTSFPVCIKDGGIPSPAEGQVNRTACRLGFFGCGAEWPIRIKNCGDYRVYHLSPSDSCPSAYCVGTEIHCAAGQCSPNGFTPGCSDCPSTTSESSASGSTVETSKSTETETDGEEREVQKNLLIGVIVGVGGFVALVVTLYCYREWLRERLSLLCFPKQRSGQPRKQALYWGSSTFVETGKPPSATDGTFFQCSRPGTPGSINLAWTHEEKGATLSPRGPDNVGKPPAENNGCKTSLTNRPKSAGANINARVKDAPLSPHGPGDVGKPPAEINGCKTSLTNRPKSAGPITNAWPSR